MSPRLARLATPVPVAAALLGLVAAAAPLVAHHASTQSDRPAATSGLGANLDRILADPALDGAQAALEVRDAKSGRVLYTHDADRRLLPASNAKLATSAAAMQMLGPDYRFSTGVRSMGNRDGHTLRGNLYLKGTGDPTMLASDYDALAGKVADSGITRVGGALVADDTYFDDQRLGPFWAWDDEPYYYDGQVSALSVAPDEDYDAGSVIVRIAPGKHRGDRAKVTVDPPNHYVKIVNGATTGGADSEDSADAVRRHGNNTIDVTGSIPAGADASKVWATVWQPTDLVASLFTDALRRHGVTVTGGHHRGATPAGAAGVATHRSMTLTKMLVPFLKLSNNMHAEHLTKAMGRKIAHAGTWSAGTKATTDAIEKLGVNSDDLRMVDGSGLSRADTISPHQLNTLLDAVQDRPWFDGWYKALPIAAEPDRLVGGTLRDRMKGTAAAGNLHGKTGSMTAVSALSGYVTDAGGHRLVFSMISNDFLDSSVTPIEDAVGVTLADYDGTSNKRVAPAIKRNVPAKNVMQRRNPSVECSWVKAC